MRGSRILLASVIMVGTVGGAWADATCESVRTDLTGRNVYGKHTMMELSDNARAGNCSDAAYLVRRAKDAQGFIETNCPTDTDLRSKAASLIQLGQDTLAGTPCQD